MKLQHVFPKISDVEASESNTVPALGTTVGILPDPCMVVLDVLCQSIAGFKDFLTAGLITSVVLSSIVQNLTLL